jgi:CMP-N-acetylneuraminic acid synthetase
MRFVALLPMKGESERVPNKNIRTFNGEPLFVHMLKTLLQVSKIDEIIINTDSEKIKELALQFDKVTIHDRPKELIGNLVPMNDIIAYDIDKSGQTYFIQTHSTNPLLTASTIEKALADFEANESNIDSIFSVTKWQTRLYWANGEAINHSPNELLRTQDLPPVFEENSSFFIFSKKSFKEANNQRIGRNPKMMEINKLEAIDIDELEDFLLAEVMQKIVMNES